MADPDTNKPLSARMDIIAHALRENFLPWIEEAAESLHQGDTRAQEINAALGVAQGEIEALRAENDQLKGALAEASSLNELLKEKLTGGSADDVKRLTEELAREKQKVRELNLKLTLQQKLSSVESPETAALRARNKVLEETVQKLQKSRESVLQVLGASARDKKPSE